MKSKNYKHVTYQWDENYADKLDLTEKLVYRSNILGNDQRITNTGGGNTSSKIPMSDPITGEDVTVLWVKGSGGDLRTSKKENFASLRMDRLYLLKEIYNNKDPKGVKTEAEDDMVAMYKHSVYNLNPRAASIDTPLHAYVPFKHVDHMHPNTLIAIAAAKNSKKLTRQIFGDEIGWIPWQRPGFDLGLRIENECKKNPDLKGLIMGQHGVINWADDARECYELSLDLIEKAGIYIDTHDKGDQTFGGKKYDTIDQDKREEILAEILPRLRGMISNNRKVIGTVQTDEKILRFVNSVDAARLASLGTSCPDHFLRTKIKPLYLDWNPQKESLEDLLKKIEAGLTSYREDYITYYQAHKKSDSPPMRDPNPTVILIPGIGMIAWGKNKSESRVTAEFYNAAIEVMYGAEAIDEYISLPMQEAFDIEYWLLEEAKLKRQPPEKELAGNIVLIIGAGGGIGKEVAHRIIREGAHVICADLNLQAAEQTKHEISKQYGEGIGVSGSGISSCGPVIASQVDITNRESIRKLLQQTLLAYGGIDHVIITAGVFPTPDKSGKVTDQMWDQAFEVNVKGNYLIADETSKIWQIQGLDGSLVLTTSVNAVVSKKGSLAYDTSKSAADHLVRELAIELAPLIRVNGIAPATVIQGSSMFPRERVISSLTKYNINFDENESTEQLISKLEKFYSQRSLLKRPVRPVDQAEIAYLLVSDRFSCTTGQIINIDAGIHEAFLR